jgi:hypothetical protein
LTVAFVLLAACTKQVNEDDTTFARENGRLIAQASSLPYSTEEVPSADAAVSNSMRGQYIWLNVAEDPKGWPATDLYWRDQLQWGTDLEKRPGEYDFATIEKGLKEVEAKRGRLSFRIMSYCPDCGDNIAPKWLPRQSTGVPDWNSDAFLEAWENLMRALGEKYNKDPRVGYVDFGGYGAAGEWYYIPKYGKPITNTNARRMMRAVLNSFPDKYVIIPWINQYPEMATSLSDRVGIRNDCIGGFEQEYFSEDNAVQTAWQRAPMVGEWCPNKEASSAVGVDTVRSFHLSMLSSGNYPRRYAEMKSTEKSAFRQANLIAGFRYALVRLSLPKSLSAGAVIDPQLTWENSGTAPTYDDWTVRLRFSPADETREPFDLTLADDLRSVRGGQVTSSNRVDIPSTAEGTYVVSVSVTDSDDYLSPMRLAMSNRQPDGSYVIGRVGVR